MEKFCIALNLAIIKQADIVFVSIEDKDSVLLMLTQLALFCCYVKQKLIKKYKTFKAGQNKSFVFLSFSA